MWVQIYIYESVLLWYDKGVSAFYSSEDICEDFVGEVYLGNGDVQAAYFGCELFCFICDI